MKIIAEDAYHRDTIRTVAVCEKVPNAMLAEIIRKSLQRELGETECKTFRVVRDDYPTE